MSDFDFQNTPVSQWPPINITNGMDSVEFLARTRRGIDPEQAHHYKECAHCAGLGYIDERESNA